VVHDSTITGSDLSDPGTDAAVEAFRGPGWRPLRVLGGLSAVGVVSFGVAVCFVLRPDQMLVEHLAVEGATEAGEAELRHLVELRNGTRIWQVDTDRIAALAEAHPWVRHAEARIDWPDTVTLTVEERHAVAVLHRDRALYVDEDGTPFLAATSDRLDLPHLTGFTEDLEALHPQLPGLAVRDALWLLERLESRGLTTASVSEVAFSPARGFTVHHGQARLVFGHGELPRQLDRLERLVREEGLDPAGPTWVDLAPATVAIVRPLPATAEGS
jgi:hypothetical protein